MRALLILSLVTAACASSVQQSTLRGALTTCDAGRAALLAYDAQHQAEIVAAAPDKATGHARLVQYRDARHAAASALEDCYIATASAAVALSTNDSDAGDMTKLKAAIGAVEDALKSLGVAP